MTKQNIKWETSTKKKTFFIYEKCSNLVIFIFSLLQKIIIIYLWDGLEGKLL